jgi:hypothetical protein
VRNRFGEISAGLEETGEAVLISKGRKIRAVLITPEPFARRFLGDQWEGSKRGILAAIASLLGTRAGEKESLAVLRERRGYEA